MKEKRKPAVIEVNCPKCGMMMDCDGEFTYECPQGCHKQ